MVVDEGLCGGWRSSVDLVVRVIERVSVCVFVRVYVCVDAITIVFHEDNRNQGEMTISIIIAESGIATASTIATESWK